MPRQFAPGQSAELWIHDLDTGERTLRFSSDELLFEAPNWTSDGWLIVNGDGRLWRLWADGDDEPEQLPGPDSPVNNDHVLDPDGAHLYASCEDGQIYRVPLPDLDGLPVADEDVVRVTHEDGWHHFLHGISPDGGTLAWIGLQVEDGMVLTDIVLSASDGTGESLFVTNDHHPDDGSEFSPDGGWLWFNSERGSTTPGHAQLFRMPMVGDEPGGPAEQLTVDERVNWFPHVSPDGTRVVYVSFEPGTLGHPDGVPVLIRELLDFENGAPTHRDLAELWGGQGAMNVNSWAPDSRRIAYVNYVQDDQLAP